MSEEHKIPTWLDTHPLCGLHACNVVISEYNENGKCKCLKCMGLGSRCHDCEQYKSLVEESYKNNESSYLERCLNCQRQR